MDFSSESFKCNNQNNDIKNKSPNRSIFNLESYQQSLQTSSNLTSLTILNKLWQNNQASRSNMKNIINCAKTLHQNLHSNNIISWKSSLSKIDPINHFEQKFNQCEKCTSVESSVGFEQFINNECKCCICKQYEGKFTNSNKPWQNSNSLLQDTEESQKLSNPKFRPKQSLKKALSTQLPSMNINVEDSKEIPGTSSNYYAGADFEGVNICPANTLDKEDEENKMHKSNVAKITFKTAKEALLATNPRRTLGASRKAQGKFVSPMIGAQEKQEHSDPIVTDERLKHIDSKMVELIESEIIDNGTPVGWDDIAGLQMAKSVIQEAVVWPLLRPDIFTGLRRPPKGILLFGPPGTGKTLIGKCVAAQCNATFFSISASSLTSKWLGDGEKMVRALFAVASCHQPAVIFIDEIDSLLTQRSDSEHEATRRIKTEFLVQFDGAATGEEDRLLIVGATNRPQELDEAARRRLVKRLYIPLPDSNAREQIVSNLLKNESNSLTQSDVERVASLTEGYSGADMKSLCSEAAMGPIRSVPLSQIVSIQRDKVRPVNMQDFINALERVRPSVSQDDLGQYVNWNKTYGQGF